MKQQVNLKPYTTFGIDANAAYFAEFTNIDDLHALLQKQPCPELLILGGGSNILFTKNPNALVLRNQLKGIHFNEQADGSVLVTAAAGEVWHEFVQYCIAHHFAGLENLSLIPGSVGASPMQNIGAYGVEIKDVFEGLKAYHIASGEIHDFTNEQCQFGYRESVFKRQLKGQYIITEVTFRLQKEAKVKTSYGAIQSELDRMGITQPSIQEVSQAVMNIRRSKLPDPAVLGNAGSFFKNPVVSATEAATLLAQFPDAPHYPAENDQVKLAAGWLIEQCGLKGYRTGHCGVHERQALVLVNYGGSTGAEVYALSSYIIQTVHERFGVELEREVNIL
ncbi:MAG: hypothetical protein RLZZ301_1558 [Bacteroidota bacterium]|jgi:UDP-N-acetylmuramate dehydrogenase